MTAIPWSSLKKVHDALARSSERFFAGGAPVPHVFFFVRVEHGNISECEVADAKTTVDMLDNQVTVDRIRQTVDAATPLASKVAHSLGFSPNVVAQMTQVLYTTQRSADPSSQSQGEKSGLFICVHTATESFPVLHPIVDQPAKHCELQEFPQQSRELTGPAAQAAPSDLEAFGKLQRRLAEEVMNAVLVATSEPWKEACLSLRIPPDETSCSAELELTLSSGTVLPIEPSAESIGTIGQILRARGDLDEPWSGMTLTVSRDGQCNVDFDYGEPLPRRQSAH
jgi:hypothetical protein